MRRLLTSVLAVLSTLMLGAMPSGIVAEPASSMASELPERAVIVDAVEHRLAVEELWDEFFRLELDFISVSDWLYGAERNGFDEAEAAMAARLVVRRIREELPLVRARMRALPDDAPGVPPVLISDPEWKRPLRARMDWLAADAEGMAQTLQAMGANDGAEVSRLYREAAQRYLAFHELDFAEHKRFRALLPEDSPDRAIGDFAWSTQPYDEANTRRAEAVDLEEWQNRTGAVLEGVAAALQTQRDATAALEASLDQFRPKLRAVLLVLVDDPTRADGIAERIMSSYAQTAARLAEELELFREIARLEHAISEDPTRQELYYSFDPLVTRLHELRKEHSSAITDRIRLLHAASQPAD